MPESFSARGGFSARESAFVRGTDPQVGFAAAVQSVAT